VAPYLRAFYPPAAPPYERLRETRDQIASASVSRNRSNTKNPR
jgi:hypothetical protein